MTKSVIFNCKKYSVSVKLNKTKKGLKYTADTEVLPVHLFDTYTHTHTHTPKKKYNIWLKNSGYQK